MPGIRPRRLFHATAVAALVAAFPTTAARAQFRVGAHAAYQTQIVEGDFGAGGRLEVDLDFIRPGVTLAGTYDHFFLDCDQCRAFEVGGELLFGPGPVFVGGGAFYRSYDPGDDPPAPRPGAPRSTQPASAEWAFSLVAGVRFPQVPVVTPFGEFRQEFGGSPNRQTISVGVLVGAGGRRRPPAGPPGAPLSGISSAGR